MYTIGIEKFLLVHDHGHNFIVAIVGEKYCDVVYSSIKHVLLARRATDDSLIKVVDLSTVDRVLSYTRFRPVKSFDVSSLDIPGNHFVFVVERCSVKELVKYRKRFRKFVTRPFSIYRDLVPVTHFDEEVEQLHPVKVGLYVFDDGGKQFSLRKLKGFIPETCERVDKFIARVLARTLHIIPSSKLVLEVGCRYLNPQQPAFIVLDRHMFVSGTTGTGKTNFLTLLSLKLPELGYRVIVFDVLGSIVSKVLRAKSMDLSRVAIVRVPHDFSFDPLYELTRLLSPYEAFAQTVEIINTGIQYTCPERDTLTAIQQQVFRRVYQLLLERKVDPTLRGVYRVLEEEDVTKLFNLQVYVDDIVKASEAVKRRLELLIPYFEPKQSVVSFEPGTTYILDLSRLSDFSKAVFMMAFLSVLIRYPQYHEFFRTKTYIIIDEVSLIAPELEYRSVAPSFLGQVLRIARNFNLFFVVASQHYTRVDAVVRANSTKLVFRLDSDDDREAVVYDILPKMSFHDELNPIRDELKAILARLCVGEAIYAIDGMYDIYRISLVEEREVPVLERNVPHTSNITPPLPSLPQLGEGKSSLSTNRILNVEKLCKLFSIPESKVDLVRRCLTMSRDELIEFIMRNYKQFFSIKAKSGSIVAKPILKLLVAYGKLSSLDVEYLIEELKKRGLS